MSTHEISHLVHQYGCLLVFAVTVLQALGAPLPGTTALVAAALYSATSHHLPIVWVIAAGAGGALVGTTIGFAIGRWGGEALLLRIGRRLRQSPERVQRLRHEFAAHGAGWLLIGRFVTGIRNVIGLVAGSSGMPLRRFLLLSAVAASAWALLNGLGYYWFGQAIVKANTWLQVVLVCVGIAWLLLSVNLLRRRALRRLRTDSTAEVR